MQLAPSLGKPSEPSTKPRPLPAPQSVLTGRTEAATSFTQAVLTFSGKTFSTPAAFNMQLANRLSPSRTKGDPIRAAPCSPRHSAHGLQHGARSKTALNRGVLQLTHKGAPQGYKCCFSPSTAITPERLLQFLTEINEVHADLQKQFSFQLPLFMKQSVCRSHWQNQNLPKTSLFGFACGNYSQPDLLGNNLQLGHFNKLDPI